MTKKKGTNLLDIMLDMSIGDIKESAEIFGFDHSQWNANSNVGKARHWLAGKIVSNPLNVLSKLPAADLVMIRQCLEQPVGTQMQCFATHTVSTAAMLNIMDYTCDDDYDYFELPADLYKAFKPNIDIVWEDVLTQTRFLAEQYLIGMTNLYGIVTLDEYFKGLGSFLSFDADGNVKDFYGWLRKQSALIALDDSDFDESSPADEVCFYSPFIWEDLKEFKDAIIKGVGHKAFPGKAIKEAGMFPTPTIPNPYRTEVLAMLDEDFGLSDDEAQYQLFQIWWRLQHDGDSWFEDRGAKDYVLHELIPAAHPVDTSAKTLQRMVETFTNYINNCPMWTLKGHCLAESDKKE